MQTKSAAICTDSCKVFSCISAPAKAAANKERYEKKDRPRDNRRRRDDRNGGNDRKPRRDFNNNGDRKPRGDRPQGGQNRREGGSANAASKES